MAENNMAQQQNQQQFDTNQQILNPLFAPSAESLRTSYFEVLTSSGSGAAPSSFSTTFVAIIVGQFVKDADRTEYAAHYQKFFKRMQSQMPATGSMMDNAGGGQGAHTDKISGMLLAFKTSFVHVLECPQKIMYAFLNDVASMNSNGGVSSESSPQLQDPLPIMTEQARILFLSDDIKKTLASHTTAPQPSQKAAASAISRNFPFWASKIVDSKEDSSPQDWSMMDEQSVDDQITNFCVQLLHVGHNLSQMTKAEMKQAFEDISDRYRGQIPTQTVTLELAALPQILSVKDWQLEFQGKMKITLESELVWPAPKPLLFA